MRTIHNTIMVLKGLEKYNEAVNEHMKSYTMKQLTKTITNMNDSGMIGLYSVNGLRWFIRLYDGILHWASLTTLW